MREHRRHSSRVRRAGSRAATLAAIALLGIAGPGAGQTSTDIWIVEVDADADGVRLSVPRNVTDRPGYDNQPAFDDGAILYTSIRDGQADTYRHHLDSGETERVTRTAPESEYSPTPLPDGSGFSVVRVEADSTQRLWRFRPDGTDPRLVLRELRPVGYHAWIDDDVVALFVLGSPPTLRIAEARTGAAYTVTGAIGRSLQPIPGRRGVSFTREVTDGEWWLHSYDPTARAMRRLVRLLGPDAYHVWLPDGSALTAHETRLYRWYPGDADWTEVADLTDALPGAITRLALSRDGRRLALVVERDD